MINHYSQDDAYGQLNAGKIGGNAWYRLALCSSAHGGCHGSSWVWANVLY